MFQLVLMGLDLGSSKIAAVTAINDKNSGLKVTGSGVALCEGGINSGEIKDMNLTVNAIKTAVDLALLTGGHTKPDEIRVSVDCAQFKGMNQRNSIITSTIDRIITILDMERIIDQASKAYKLSKEEIILHCIPQIYHVDKQHNVKNPLNMVGDTLEAEIRIISAPSNILQNINRALDLSGIRGATLMHSPLASAEAILCSEEAENGAIIIDIGHQLTHVGIYLRGSLLYSAVIPIGGSVFTNDLALILGRKHGAIIPILEAEQVKRTYSTVLPMLVNSAELVSLDSGLMVNHLLISRILHARAVELLQSIRMHIVHSGMKNEICRKVYFIGCGSLLLHLPNLAENILGESQISLGKISGVQGIPNIYNNFIYVNAVGAVKSLHYDLSQNDCHSLYNIILDKLLKWPRYWFELFR